MQMAWILIPPSEMAGGIFAPIFNQLRRRNREVMMIQVRILSREIRMQGHADRSVNGQDIVCSAISALTCNLINSLEELTDNRIRAETASGKTVIEWEQLDDKGQILIDSWFLGLTAINQEYNCIEFI